MADYLTREEQEYDAVQPNTEIEQQEQDQLDAELAEQAKTIDTESGVKSGEKAGPTLEPSRRERADQFVGDNSQEFPVLEPMAMGVADTAMDAVGAIGQLVPWLSPLSDLDDDYDANFGRDTETDPAKKMIRDISATVVPTLTIGGAGASLMKGAAAARGLVLSSRANLLARIGFEAGVGTGVTAVSDQTDEQENVATLMYEFTGLDLPWRHVDGDSPYWTFAKNMVEDVFFNIGGAALEAYTASKSITKHIPKNEVSSQYLGEKIAPLAAAREELGDPVAAAVKVKDDARQAEINRETIQRLGQNADNPNPYYDAFINEPHLPSERSVKNYNANIVDFKTDVARMANNIGADEVGGRARPAVTPGMMKLVGQGDEAREEALKNFGEALDVINVDTQIGDNLITEEMKQAAIDQLVDRAANLEGMDFAKAVGSLREAIEPIRGNTVQYLGADNAEVGMNALDRMMDVLDPQRLKGSAVVAYQAGKDITDSAAAINIGSNSNWTARQQEQIIQNIPILMQEVRSHQFIKGYTLKMLDMVKRAKADGVYNVDWINNKNQEFSMNLKATREKALEFTNRMYDISQENPEYFKPLYHQFLRTNGDIDTLYKLNKLMEERMGLWGKGLGFGNKKIPSILVKELQGVIYNSVLYGFAPVRAGADAALHTVVKPVTTLLGYASQGKFGQMKRAMYGFGGFAETFQRGLKHASDEWRFAVQHPDFAHSRARADVQAGSLQDYDTMELMMEAWENEKTPGNQGKLFTAQAIKTLSWWNRYTPENKVGRHLGPRAGVNALSYVDGFTKSLQASFVARTKAYDEVFERTNGAFDEDLFDTAQKRLYDSMFDKNGVMTGDAALYSAGEMNLNLDNDMVAGVEKMVNDIPILKSLFLFPRTGMNELTRITTFNPLGPLGLAMGKARKAIRAKTDAEIADVLKTHGYLESDRAAFETIRAEYIGRQNMSAMIVTGIGMSAMFGNVTGSGPTNHAERRRWIELGGYQPYSIKVGETEDGKPIWVSYKGSGFLETLLGMTADVVFHANKVDKDADEWFGAIAGAIGMNIANKSFLSGFEPLVSMLSGDKGAINRFLAQNVNSMLPYSGARNILSRTIAPQLKDVENNFSAYMAHKNRFIPGVGDKIVNSVDIYTGEPINYTVPIINHIQGLLPFGHINARMEPWRQRLLESGWDGKKTLLHNPDTKEKYTPEQRQWMNNYIGKKGVLGRQVQEIFSKSDGEWKKTIDDYKKQRPGLVKELLGQGFSQKSYPWKKTILMEYLTRMHNEAYEEARAALIASDTDLGRAVIMQDLIEGNIKDQQFDRAASGVEQLQQFNSTK